ncbi:MAG: pyroglutamyl-peptidase I [Anaerolineae bacterium]|nr:pyroglutamyl-peptidase I [Anaerolineae bacterium]
METTTRALVTGFEPFGDETLNPTAQIVSQIAACDWPGFDLQTAVLPVDTYVAPTRLRDLLARYEPHIVLLLGLARGRVALSLERVAINLLNFAGPDNAGNRIQDQPVIPGGPAAYFATLPVREIVERLRKEGIPTEVSYSAGTFLCNQVFYTALHWADQSRLDARVGFLHTPAAPAQVALGDRLAPSMALEMMLNGVRRILEMA